jgi:hypothetical protein
MYPPQNPPPLQDSYLPKPRDIPRSLVISAVVRTRFIALLVYCLCGILSGVIVGGLSTPAHYGLNEWDHSMEKPVEWGIIMLGPTRNELDPWSVFLPGARDAVAGLEVHKLLLTCSAATGGYGIFGGGFLWLVVCFWPAAKHPVFTATLCASLAGSFVLVLIAQQHMGGPLKEEVILRDLVGMAAGMAFAAVFGFLHALLARRSLRWLGRFEPHAVEPENV